MSLSQPKAPSKGPSIAFPDDISQRLTCPECNSELGLYQVHFNCQVKICPNTNCTYPFSDPAFDRHIGTNPASPVPPPSKKAPKKPPEAATSIPAAWPDLDLSSLPCAVDTAHMNLSSDFLSTNVSYFPSELTDSASTSNQTSSGLAELSLDPFPVDIQMSLDAALNELNFPDVALDQLTDLIDMDQLDPSILVDFSLDGLYP
ncbi:hypothetical protein H4R33_000826 [Dimargaris cristalligena]|uniref:Uncharacterized protein n=1 Tax=Dimargaris cristalligena TaxID=215637 RepID=A0A4Q0A2L4_9FUNG|nr:hypothetical protein H4R33_000826 [Dimargaris cristalligena]RKP39420.1 hypothetical protein BJ085DRAFT_34362 [Dimargaris cristalligena]|eukprot:RKP39420.1 hypothetical protein BJ085DRAFT_34362 [Dimargaris cristalligena]